MSKALSASSENNTMVIKIYARRVRAYTGRKIPTRGKWERYTCHFGMWAGEDGLLLYTEGFDEGSRRAIDLILEFAESKLKRDEEVEVQILDIMKSRDGLKAVFDNIKTIPTIIIGKQRIGGVPTKEELAVAMVDC